MYAGGLFAAASTVDYSSGHKLDLLERMFALTSIERLSEVFGSDRIGNVLELYDYFLEKMSDEEVRKHLSSVDKGNHDDPVFRDLKNKGHQLTRELLVLFEQRFHRTHPIHRCIAF